MDRRYVIGFCLGVVVVLVFLWGFSAWDNYQKGEQTRDATHDQVMALNEQTHDQVMALNEQTQMMRSSMMDMRSELSTLKSRMDANDSKMNNLMDLRLMMEDRIAGLRHDLGLQ